MKWRNRAGRGGSGPRDRNLPQGQISETTQMFLPRPAR